VDNKRSCSQRFYYCQEYPLCTTLELLSISPGRLFWPSLTSALCTLYDFEQVFALLRSRRNEAGILVPSYTAVNPRVGQLAVKFSAAKSRLLAGSEP
jgi:hypothetical protein